MTDTALIQGGIVHEIWRGTSKASLTGRFTPELINAMIEFPDGKANSGDFWNGTTLIPQATYLLSLIPTPDPTVVSLQNSIVALAQTAVGVRIDALTAPQLRALVAVLFWEHGAIAADLTVRPLAQWITPRS